MEAKANKFSTNLQRSIKNRIAIVLIYTLLEWTLIFLLLLQGLFSYLVTSFASYFALHPPCILCSRLDHLFRADRGGKAYLDHLCHSHKAEISHLGYCTNHRKLAGAAAMCEDCSSSAPPAPEGKDLRCSCCDVVMESEFFEVELVSWGDLRSSHVGELDVYEKEMGKIGACEEIEDLGCGINEESIKEHAEKKEESSVADVSREDMESTEIVNMPEEAEEESMLVAVNNLDANSSNFTVETSSLGGLSVDGQEIRNPENSGTFAQENYETLVQKEVYDCQHAKKLQLELENPENRSSGEDEHCTLTLMRENGDIETELVERMSCHVSECHRTEIESELAPATPISVDAIDNLSKSLLLDMRETGTEYLDGSAINDGQEGVLTLEHFKSALCAERRTLAALYAELEEERNASAVAANHTMAMITRLQEEKAAMQMEALQYQRMMEEQSEYDQEAVQLLNELMVKREKENQELEKELEVYRKKVLFYEEKERQRIRRSRAVERSVSSSESSCVDDSDDLSASFDYSEDSFHGQKNCNALVLRQERESSEHPSTVSESLTEFEKERLSILDQLNKLEEKLFLMGDDNGLAKENAHRGHLPENGYLHYSLSSGLDVVSKHITHAQENISLEGKNLLPLFDAALVDDEDEHFREEEFVSDLTLGQTKMSMEEELQSIYERLYAFEADREFLKHCLSSLKKGDKGMDLLQEILQHLRDLRRIELQNRKICEIIS